MAKKSESGQGEPYVIVRGNRSGCFAGYLVSRAGTEVVLRECRRLWHWEGAATLSQLAMEGVSKPQNCKFPMPTARHEVLDALEVIEASALAKTSIQGVAIWSS